MQWQILSGLSDYAATLARMAETVRAVQNGAPDALWLLEHPPLYTAGSSAKPHDLLTPAFPVLETGRGGQYTYHGPGQRVAYIISDLKRSAAHSGKQPDLRAFVQQLESWIIAALGALGVQGFLREGRVGVWVNTPTGEAKIAALGVRVQKWVTSHGIAINVNPDLSHYGGIVPCGLSQFGVTSLHALGVNVSMAQLDEALKLHCPWTIH